MPSKLQHYILYLVAWNLKKNLRSEASKPILTSVPGIKLAPVNFRASFYDALHSLLPRSNSKKPQKAAARRVRTPPRHTLPFTIEFLAAALSTRIVKPRNTRYTHTFRPFTRF